MIETELIAGLYDENDNLIVTYEESGLIADAIYTSSSYKTDAGSGYSTFNRYPAAKKMILPASVTSIGSYAFYGCSSLTKLELPDSLTHLSAQAFTGCTALKELHVGSGLSELSMWYNAASESGLHIDLSGADSLETVNVHGNVYFEPALT